MKKTDVFRTLEKGERVTSVYAQTYLNDDYCEFKKPTEKSDRVSEPEKPGAEDEWISPSDLLIGIVDLKPPFTSKITRGITHQGILDIGNDVLERERVRFLNYMSNVISENDAAWNYILEHEKSSVAKKVKAIYHDILMDKSKTLLKEINIFYEQSLQELEDHLRSEVQNVLVTAHANIISDLNFEIRDKLKKERLILEDVLQKRFDSEIEKITHYYKLLLDNEIYRNQKLVNQAIFERNDALKAFYKQIEAQNITSTMYVMCTERKKCKIRKFLLENIHSTEIAEKLQKIKERQEIIDSFKSKEKQISDINKEWEIKIKKILKLFLKFVSFSLKLLPEQTTFLLDLEKMVVLQLNEMQKAPMKNTSILIDDNDEENILEFEKPKEEDIVCDKEPFVIEGDLNDPVPPQYGSRETLASDVELPYIRLQRKFIYAKCGKMDEVRAFLESQRCKCRDPPPEVPEPELEEETEAAKVADVVEEVQSEASSYEPLLLDDIEILKHCPVRKCQDWVKRYSFPWLVSYLDFSEENYERVKTILGKLPDQDPIPELIDPTDIINQELPFGPTKEPFHNVGTQYSSQDDVSINFTCPCMGGNNMKIKDSEPKIKMSESREIKNIVLQRQQSFERVLNEHPKLLKLFTDESYDFVYTIK
ncbi:uncharacterized protein LOC111358546 [Spodoptera litura]|uniref:Uncharacterized protein LOC111358546 n=1 Tax=Spodoptera litura TaxID=69820 RepID=A0A9J7EEQ9_SPOLT|nr:uncharacterized protein LOC111358546 [Spodoptera litura]